jgi:N-methylhydantoinase A/oxoprolinase/acetone carboxylase beta subunit
VALVTTKGFEDVVEIGRQDRGELYNLFWQPRGLLVSKALRFGLSERVDYEGRILKRLTIDEVNKLCYRLKKLKVECIAISFLHSYKNSKNEIDGEDSEFFSIPFLLHPRSFRSSGNMKGHRPSLPILTFSLR